MPLLQHETIVRSHLEFSRKISRNFNAGALIKFGGMASTCTMCSSRIPTWYYYYRHHRLSCRACRRPSPKPPPQAIDAADLVTWASVDSDASSAKFAMCEIRTPIIIDLIMVMLQYCLLLYMLHARKMHTSVGNC